MASSTARMIWRRAGLVLFGLGRRGGLADALGDEDGATDGAGDAVEGGGDGWEGVVPGHAFSVEGSGEVHA